MKRFFFFEGIAKQALVVRARIHASAKFEAPPAGKRGGMKMYEDVT